MGTSTSDLSSVHSEKLATSDNLSYSEISEHTQIDSDDEKFLNRRLLPKLHIVTNSENIKVDIDTPETRQKSIRQKKDLESRLNHRDRTGRTPLFHAISSNNSRVVNKLLQLNADPNSKDNQGWTPLHEACLYGNLDILQTLHNFGADCNIVGGPDLEAPLHDAVRRGWQDIVEELLEYGADVNIKNKKGQTPLDIVKSEFPEIRNLLIRHCHFQKLVLKCDKYGRSMLHRAVSGNRLSETIELLNYGADPNATDNAGWTPLHEAALEGRTSIVLLLLARGANANSAGFNGETPLHDASGNGHEVVVLKLLEFGADPLLKNHEGKSAYDVARTNEIADILRAKKNETFQHTEPRNTVSIYSEENALESQIYSGFIPNTMNKLQSTSPTKPVVGTGKKRGRPPKKPKPIISEQGEPSARKEMQDVSKNNSADFSHNFIKYPLKSQGMLSREERKIQQTMAMIQRMDKRSERQKSRKHSYMRTVSYGGPRKRKYIRRIKSGEDSADNATVENGYPSKKRVLPAPLRTRRRDASGRTLLHRAADRGEVELVRELLEEIHTEHYASADSSVHMSLSENVNARDNGGWTPLHSAAIHGHLKCCELLLGAGANPCAQADNGDTPLHDAAENGYDLVCELLVKAGADVKIRNAMGRRPINLWDGSLNIHELLRGSDIDEPPVENNESDLSKCRTQKRHGFPQASGID